MIAVRPAPELEDLPILLSEVEVAQSLRIAPRTLRELRAKKKIAFVQVTPRNIAYRREDVEAYVAMCLRRPEAVVEPAPKGRARPAKGPAAAGVIVPFSQRNRR